MMSVSRVVFLVALVSSLAWAIPLESVPNPLEVHNSWFSDNANILEEPSMLALDDEIDALEQLNGTQLTVVTIKDTDGRTPKEFATALFNHWGVGEAGVNNGVMVLVVMNQRRIEIEVGDGANLYLTDADCAAILNQEVVPHFKRGDPNAGVVAAVRAIIADLRSVDYSAPPPRAPVAQPVRTHQPTPYRDEGGGGFPWTWGFAPVALGGIWGVRRYFRNRPRVCPGCRRPMIRYDENADDQYLDSGQRREEKLGSVDYDVWVCEGCDEQKIARYAKWFSGFSKCPSCRYKTMEVENVTLSSATTMSEGRGKRTENCRNCTHFETSYYTIARIQESSSSSSSSSSFSSGGGFGGGSSSGGGSGASW